MSRPESGRIVRKRRQSLPFYCKTIKRQPAESGRLSCDTSIFYRIRHEVLFDHQRHFEHDGVVELAQIQPREPLDLFQTVHQRVPVNKQLPGGLGNVQIVFKEALDRKEGFLIERIDGCLLYTSPARQYLRILVIGQQ